MNISKSIILIVAIGLLLLGIFVILPVFGDTYESSDSENYLFVQIDNNNNVSGIIQINGKIISINSDVDRFYKNGAFKVKLYNDNVLMFVSPSKLLVNVIDLTERQKYSFDIEPIDTTTYEQFIKEELSPLEKFQQAQNQTGPLNIAEQNRIEEERLQEIEEEKRLQEIANKTPRSEYQSIDDVLELIVRPDFHVPLMTTFDFNLRSIDQNYNPYSQFYGGGYLDDVSITGKIIDPDENVKKTITGNTDEEGYFAAPGLYIPYNTPLNQEWSIEITGIKYFDDIEKFSTFSIVKPFFVVVNPSLIIDNVIDLFAPTGTITILSVNGTTNNISPELELTCNDYNRNNILIIGGCKSMAFSLNGNFTGSETFDFEENYTYPGELEVGENTIYVQYTDDSLQENVSTEEISDNVIYEE